MRATLTGVLLAAAVAAASAQETHPDLAAAKEILLAKPKRIPEYPQAIRLLRGLVENNTSTEQAIPYLRFAEADLQVHIAQRLFDKGQRAQALKVIDSALSNTVLGPNARKSVEERKAKMLASPAVEPPSDAEEEKVRTTSGKQLARSRTLELTDPESGQSFFIDLMDPVALNRDRFLRTDPRPAGTPLLDVVARGIPPAEEGTPGDLGNGAALNGATDALGGLLR